MSLCSVSTDWLILEMSYKWDPMLGNRFPINPPPPSATGSLRVLDAQGCPVVNVQYIGIFEPKL